MRPEGPPNYILCYCPTAINVCIASTLFARRYPNLSLLLLNMAKSKSPSDDTDIPHERAEPRPDFSKQPPPTKLPASLQATLDSDEKLWDVLYEGRGSDSTTSDVRYAAYASRVRTILLSAQRYVAYTSDIGESFRPVAHPWLVRSAYGISWAYLIGDVSHEGYKAYARNQRTLGLLPASDEKVDPQAGIVPAQELKHAGPQSIPATAVDAAKSLAQTTPKAIAPLDDYRTVMAQRAVFQGIASMGLPAFTIHSIVRYSGRAMKDLKNTRLRTWGPIGLGLAAVPALPYMFDAPVEHAVEWVFHKGFEMAGADVPGKEKEKEL